MYSQVPALRITVSTAPQTCAMLLTDGASPVSRFGHVAGHQQHLAGEALLQGFEGEQGVRTVNARWFPAFNSSSASASADSAAGAGQPDTPCKTHPIRLLSQPIIRPNHG
jgi:hypothetical protein